MAALLRLAYLLRRRTLALLRWRTTGVKVMVFDPAGRVLLVRHGYGRSDLHMLPGGGIARGEAPADAAVRELREETCVTLRDVAMIGRYESRTEGRRDIVHLYRATTDDIPVPDGHEVIEAGFFALDALPETMSPATQRRMAESRGERSFDGRW